MSTFGKVWRIGIAVLMGIGLAVFSASRALVEPNHDGAWAIEVNPLPPSQRSFP